MGNSQDGGVNLGPTPTLVGFGAIMGAANPTAKKNTMMIRPATAPLFFLYEAQKPIRSLTSFDCT